MLSKLLETPVKRADRMMAKAAQLHTPGSLGFKCAVIKIARNLHNTLTDESFYNAELCLKFSEVVYAIQDEKPLRFDVFHAPYLATFQGNTAETHAYIENLYKQNLSNVEKTALNELMTELKNPHPADDGISQGPSHLIA